MPKIRFLNLLLFGFFISALAGCPAFAYNDTRAFLDGVEDYNNGNYEKAVNSFESLASSGFTNADLAYNIGNAHFKNRDLGKAILWYERALKLKPNDPDLIFNLQYARSMVEDEAIDRESGLLKVVFFIHGLISPRLVQVAALSANALFWLFFLTWKLKRKRPFRLIYASMLIITILFTPAAAYKFYQDAYKKEGVILEKELPVRAGRSDDSTILFVLHEGTKVEVQDTANGYYRIYYDKGKTGWVRPDSVGVI